MDKIKAYASYFVSYLLSELNGDFNIGEIILFGSAARGETTRGSDVDIFIEEKKENKRFEIDKTLHRYKTTNNPNGFLKRQ